MKRVQLRVTDEQALYIKMLSIEHDSTECEVYREMLNDYIIRNPLKLEDEITV